MQRPLSASKHYGLLQLVLLDVRVNSLSPSVFPEIVQEYLTFRLVLHRIPISLLELNTLGHAVCALFIYLLWWEKPFEVDVPTTVNIQALLDIFALAWINTK